MRILVAFKVTPDFELLRDADWAAAATRGVETRYVRRILNCFDESAIELALRAADGPATQRATATRATGGAPAGAPPVELSAVSIGGREVEPYLKTLTALGYERATRIDPGAAQSERDATQSERDATQSERDATDTRDTAPDLDFAPAVVAALIAWYAHDVDQSDLVVLGCRSGPGDGGTVPFRVAEELGWPCLSQVTALEVLADGRLRATCATDDGLARLTLRGPCVLAIGNAVVSSLRAPTLKERLAHRDEPLDVLTAEALGSGMAAACREQARRLTGLVPIDRTRAGTLVDGPTPQAKARALYDTYLRARLRAVTRASSPLGSTPHPVAPLPAISVAPRPVYSPPDEPYHDLEPSSSPSAGAFQPGASSSSPPYASAEAVRLVAVIDATGDREHAISACATQAGALAAFLRDGLKGELTGETLVFHGDEGDRERLVELAPTRDVRLVRVPARRPDLMAGALAGAMHEHDVALVLAAAGAGTIELATRLACRTGAAALTGALDLELATGRLHGHAAVYSGHLRGRFELSGRRWCVTLDACWNDDRGAVIPPVDHVVLSRTDATAVTGEAGEAGSAGDAGEAGEASFTDLELLDAPPAIDLVRSRFLVVAGYGAGDRARLERIARAARHMGADFGVSRPVVMNAWAPADRLVGVSGSRATPELCIVAGASGAPALYWGIERAGFIVALNPDEHAPIARNADLVVRDDGLAVIEALAELVNADA
ncbi:MAG TPA: FAD-binding protein [Thermoleophilia bacterium]|nr:FAD-binding protein [Thermoleophilia bacterium]